MSLILEALKKSEAERRLGQAPGLLDSQPLAARRGSRRWRAPALALLVLLVAAAAYWLGQRGSTAENGVAESLVQQSQPAPALAVREDSAEAPPPAPAASAPAASATAPTAPATRLPSDPGFRSVERESVPQHAQALPPPPQPTPPVPAGTAAAPVPPPAASAPPPVDEPSTAPALPAPEPRSPAPEPAAPRDVLPTLSQLSATQREGLPPLRISMHVYTEDPATRVVIIDGRRLREGESIAPGLQLQAIERDGSVVDHRGLRFRLPRP